MYDLVRAREAYCQNQLLKKELVQERQMIAARRTPYEQFARLDEKFGPGIGAAKERAKLRKQMEGKS